MDDEKCALCGCRLTSWQSSFGDNEWVCKACSENSDAAYYVLESLENSVQLALSYTETPEKASALVRKVFNSPIFRKKMKELKREF